MSWNRGVVVGQKSPFDRDAVDLIRAGHRSDRRLGRPHPRRRCQRCLQSSASTRCSWRRLRLKNQGYGAGKCP